jgi:dCMP deaminase
MTMQAWPRHSPCLVVADAFIIHTQKCFLKQKEKLPALKKNGILTILYNYIILFTNNFIIFLFYSINFAYIFNMNSSRAKLRDEVYTQMMCAQARLSKDQNTQMGAVLVSADGRVISTGYNGAPAGFDDETVPYTREKQLLAYDLLDADTGELISHHEFEANKYPFMVHAEINALHYARGKVPPGSKLYVIGFPCERCSLDISLSGVAEVFVTKDDYDPKSTLNNSRDTAYYMFAQAGIVVTLCGKRIRPIVSKPNK